MASVETSEYFFQQSIFYFIGHFAIIGLAVIGHFDNFLSEKEVVLDLHLIVWGAQNWPKLSASLFKLLRKNKSLSSELSEKWIHSGKIMPIKLPNRTFKAT